MSLVQRAQMQRALRRLLLANRSALVSRALEDRRQLSASAVRSKWLWGKDALAPQMPVG